MCGLNTNIPNTQIGGGDASAAKQEEGNLKLEDVKNRLDNINGNLVEPINGNSVANLLMNFNTENPILVDVLNTLNNINSNLENMYNLLSEMRDNQTTGAQRVVIQDVSGNTVDVNSDKKAIKTVAG